MHVSFIIIIGKWPRYSSINNAARCFERFQVVGGRAFPVTRLAMPLMSMESLEIPVEARAQVSENDKVAAPSSPPAPEQHTQQALTMLDQEEIQDESSQAAHCKFRCLEAIFLASPPPPPPPPPMNKIISLLLCYTVVQPRSVRSVPDAFVHPREKRVRRCACNCAC